MPLDIGVLAKDANVAPNIRKEANRATTVQIKARGDAAHSFTAYHVTSDASSNRDKFLSTRVLEAASSYRLAAVHQTMYSTKTTPTPVPVLELV